MKSQLKALQKAESKALRLFDRIEELQLIQPNITELELNESIYQLAKDEFKVNKFWHKRIVRAGENTLHPYKENPPNLTIRADDILFIDLGPIFDQHEADIGRTFVLGNDPRKIALKNAVKQAWHKANTYFQQQKSITGAELFQYCKELAQQAGWEFGGEIAGHIVGKFPHQNIENLPKDIYIHPENNSAIKQTINDLDETHWIIEIHFVDKAEKIGGFYEQLALPASH